MPIDKKAVRKEVSAYIAGSADELTRITQELIRIPSVNPPGDYQAMAEKMAELYRAEKLEPVTISATDQEIRDLGLTTPRPNVVAMHKGTGGGKVLCLDAHMDVVETGDPAMWTFPPFSGELHEGRIYGRGAEDTKSHLAIQLIVSRALRELGIELEGDLMLTSTVDDEIGQWPGMGFLIEQGFEKLGLPKPDYHVVGEPTGIDQLACLARGRLWYDITIKGRAAHGGNPEAGVNAVEKAIDLANMVRAMDLHSDPLMGRTTMNLGILQGGNSINLVPASARITFDIRPSTPRETVKEFMESCLEKLKAQDPDFMVESLKLVNFRQSGGIGPDHEFVKTVSAITKEVTGKDVSYTGGGNTGYSSLGNAYWTYINGVASIMYGGGHFSRAHAVDEYIKVAELVEAAQVFAGLAVELLCE